MINHSSERKSLDNVLIIRADHIAAAVFRESLGTVARQNKVSSYDCILLNQNFVLSNISRKTRYWSNIHCKNKKVDSSLDTWTYRSKLVEKLN